MAEGKKPTESESGKAGGGLVISENKDQIFGMPTFQGWLLDLLQLLFLASEFVESQNCP